MLIDLDTSLNANVTYGVTVGLEIFSIDLKYTESVDANINMQSKLLINTALNVLQGAIIGLINDTLFHRGRSFGQILIDTPLCWLNLDQIFVSPNYS